LAERLGKSAFMPANEFNRFAKKWESWMAALRMGGNRRLLLLTALSFSSGLPFGFVMSTIPVWLRTQKVGLETIGIFALTSLPWGIKFLWAPLIDRFRPRRPGPRRGWILATQIALAAAVLSTALLNPQSSAWTLGLIAFMISFFSATQDIAVDAYGVEIMKREEYGVGNGMRIASYRIAMLLSGGAAIAAAAWLPWSTVITVIGLLFILCTVATLAAPEPTEAIRPPGRLRDAVVEPFLTFFRMPRSYEIALFIFLFKVGDSVAGHMLSPFLVDQGYHLAEIGIAQKTIGMISVLLGSLAGGLLTSAKGLRVGLSVGAIVQAVSNAGYWIMAIVGFSRPTMYTAISVENFCAGMGATALMAYLMSLCDKRYAAAQYALFTSLFGLSRSLTGPLGGYMATKLGYGNFFAASIFIGLPAVLMAFHVPTPKLSEASGA
jgi:MFS transporter, PAT family, beta-lactamase induction signal transducer AmpG